MSAPLRPVHDPSRPDSPATSASVVMPQDNTLQCGSGCAGSGRSLTDESSEAVLLGSSSSCAAEMTITVSSSRFAPPVAIRRCAISNITSAHLALSELALAELAKRWECVFAGTPRRRPHHLPSRSWAFGRPQTPPRVRRHEDRSPGSVSRAGHSDGDDGPACHHRLCLDILRYPIVSRES